MIRFRLVAAALLFLFLASCGFLRPGETAMQTAIGDYVLQEEDYPREFIV